MVSYANMLHKKHFIEQNLMFTIQNIQNMFLQMCEWGCSKKNIYIGRDIRCPPNRCTYTREFLQGCYEQTNDLTLLNGLMLVTNKILFIVFFIMEPSQKSSFLSHMMMVLGFSLPLSIVLHITPPLPPKSKKDWKDYSTTLLMDLFEKSFFLVNSMNDLTQQQW